MKGEVGSCGRSVLTKKWETVRPRPTSPRIKSSAAKQREMTREVQRILQVLHSWGIHTLGQFAALRKDDVAARLGPTGVHMWERAAGKSERVLQLQQPREVFEERFEFEHEVETTEPLLFILRRFLEQLQQRLSAHYLVTKALTLTLTFANKSTYERRFEIPQPTTDVQVLFRMLETHLEMFTSEHPIIAVVAAATPTRPGRQQFGLFDTALRNPTQLHETLARLTGLLGADRVGTPVVEETHRPDTFRLEPFAWELPDALSNEPTLLHLALRRFRNDNAATVLLADRKPAHVQSAALRGNVQDTQGPFASSGDWWDAQRWARVEWDVELQDAVARCHQHRGGWSVDGVYD